MTKEKMKLTSIVLDAIGFGVVSIPVYSGYIAMTSEQTMVDALTDEKTVYLGLAMMCGKIMVNGGKRLYQSMTSKQDK